jgi:phosphoglycolate phosphatase
MAKKLFLFDFDGVLVDSLDVYHRAVSACLAKIGTPIIKTQEEYVALFADNFYAAMARKGVDLEAFSAALTEYEQSVDYYQDVQPFAAILPVLEELCGHNILVIVSSNSSQTIWKILARLRYDSCFQDIFGSEFHLSKKIKIDHAVATYGVSRGNTYYVGDTSGDVREGKAAGVKTIAITWGWHSRKLLTAARPDFLIDDPEELKSLG